jgi:hypothetical protein
MQNINYETVVALDKKHNFRGLVIEMLACHIATAMYHRTAEQVPETSQIIFGKTEDALAIDTPNGMLTQVIKPVFRILCIWDHASTRLALTSQLITDPNLLLDIMARLDPNVMFPILKGLETEELVDDILHMIATCALAYMYLGHESLVSAADYVMTELGSGESGIVTIETRKIHRDFNDLFWVESVTVQDLQTGDPKACDRFLVETDIVRADMNPDLSTWIKSVERQLPLHMDQLLAQPESRTVN